MTGQRATLDDSTVCSVERALLDTSFIYLFIFIEGNAVSVINLNYSSCMQSFTWKIVKTFLEKNFFWKQFMKNNFFHFWLLKVMAHKSPGA